TSCGATSARFLFVLAQVLEQRAPHDRRHARAFLFGDVFHRRAFLLRQRDVHAFVAFFLLHAFLLLVFSSAQKRRASTFTARVDARMTGGSSRRRCDVSIIRRSSEDCNYEVTPTRPSPDRAPCTRPRGLPVPPP